jgi:hypothetical protein
MEHNKFQLLFNEYFKSAFSGPYVYFMNTYSALKPSELRKSGSLSMLKASYLAVSLRYPQSCCAANLKTIFLRMSLPAIMSSSPMPGETDRQKMKNKFITVTLEGCSGIKSATPGFILNSRFPVPH